MIIVIDVQHGFRALGPAVRNLLERYGLSLNQIQGTGPRGLLLKGDVLSHIQKGNLQPIPSNTPYFYHGIEFSLTSILI